MTEQYLTIERKELMLKYTGLVPAVVARLNVPHMQGQNAIEKCDLIQAGMIGLMKAAKSYDPTRGCFSTYAWRRIYGEVRDLLRNQDWVPRSVRKSKTPAYEMVAGSAVKPEMDCIASSQNAAADAENSIIADIMNNVLSEREKAIVLKHIEGYTFKELADEIGVVESRAFQIYNAALKKLRIKLAA